MPAMSLWAMRGRVREVKANCTKEQADGFINRSIQNAVDRHAWADLLKTGMVVIPQNYSAGTINITTGSNQIVGVGTAWPVNDEINTVISQPINESPGYVEIFPASMAKIAPGKFLLLDQENPSQAEIVVVTSVGPASFWAYCLNQHATPASIQKSSLANMQLQGPDYVYTVQAILSPTLLQVDLPTGNTSQTGLDYQIVKAYVQVSPTARRLKYAWDAIAGQPVGVQKTVGWLNNVDPQRTSSQQPQEMVQTFPAAGGIMQWECWPYQESPYGLQVIYDDGWPVLKYDTDLSPWFMNAEVFISDACAIALRTKVIARQGQQDPYYDPTAAQWWSTQHEELISRAIESDEGRYLKALTNYMQSWQGGAVYNYYRNHIGAWPSDFGV